MSVRSVATGIAAVAAAAITYGVLIERNMFGVRTETCDVLPAGGNPLTVLHISDLHLAPWQRHKIEWVRSLASTGPDLVVVTGDSLGHRDALPALRQALAPFAGIPGVYVHGSNDYFGPHIPNPATYLWRPSELDESREALDTAGLEDLYHELGWVGVNNAATRLNVGGNRLLLVGTDDPHIGRDRLDLVTAAVEEQLENGDPIDTVIGITHAPYTRVLNTLTTLGADIIFAGHTHGGQLCIPGVGALTTNSDLPVALARGLAVWNHESRSSYLNVSAGLGTSIYAPMRFACPPEAILLSLGTDDIG
ncbi:MAG: metallophosphoesterase [Microbacteriaceae bacterium]